MRGYIGLRHDIDTHIGLMKGLQKVIDIERKYDVRSTFFIRVKVLKNKDREIIRFLHELERDGWEIGLHLDNLWRLPDMDPPEKELEFLRSLGFNIYGATPHGGVYKVNDMRTWKTLESLNLSYIQCTNQVPKEIRTLVIPHHVTLDWYIKKYGESKGYYLFKRKIEDVLTKEGYTVVMTHPEYFILSTGFVGSVGARSLGYRIKVEKIINKMTIPFLTLFGKRLTIEAYDNFLNDFRDYEFLTLYELSRRLF